MTSLPEDSINPEKFENWLKFHAQINEWRRIVRVDEETILVSKSSSGSQAELDCGGPAFSGDAQSFVFSTASSEFVPAHNGTGIDVFKRGKN